jgi:hypothetical protein
MARTTVDIEDPILKDLKDLQKRERKPLGRLISELLAEVLAQRKRGHRPEPPQLCWSASSMRARVDLGDKEAVWNVLDGGDDRDG